MKVKSWSKEKPGQQAVNGKSGDQARDSKVQPNHNIIPIRSQASVPQKDIDLALVIRAQEGDYQAFDALVKKYQHRLLALAQRFVGSPDEAMDVVQDSFIKIYKALGRFRGESAFYTWIYRITVNTALNFIKRKKLWVMSSCWIR